MPTDYSEMKPAEIAASIGEELFAQKTDTPESPSAPESGDSIIDSTLVAPETPTAPAAPDANPAIPAIVSGQNSELKALPKSWKKDMAPHWEKLPKEVHDYVYAREADVMRGIQQYQSGHQSWDSLVKPFAPIFQQHPDVNPVQLMQGLMNTHLQLLNPSASPAQKAQLAQRILADYGISLDGAETPPADARLQSEIAALKASLNEIRSSQTARERAEYDRGVKTELQTVEAFAADPKHEYFNEVGNDILRFVQTGVAADLASAYDMACWANPAIRAKMLAKQQALSSQVPARGPTGKFVNITSDDVPTIRNRKSGSIDETISGIIAKHSNSH